MFLSINDNEFKGKSERGDWRLGKTVLRKRYLGSYLKGQKKFKRWRGKKSKGKKESIFGKETILSITGKK